MREYNIVINIKSDKIPNNNASDICENIREHCVNELNDVFGIVVLHSDVTLQEVQI